MRIDLQCPYAEKDAAKVLGARWDAGRKTWFIADIEDITPFMRWIPRPDPSTSKSRHKKKRGKPDHHAMKTTGHWNVAGCACDVLPWEDCKHTAAVV